METAVVRLVATDSGEIENLSTLMMAAPPTWLATSSSEEVAAIVEKRRDNHVLWTIYDSEKNASLGFAILFKDVVEELTYDILELWMTPESWENNVAVSAAKQAIQAAVGTYDLHSIVMLLDHRDRATYVVASLRMHYYGDVTYHNKRLQLFQYVRPLPCRAYGSLSAHFYDINVPSTSSKELAFYKQWLRGINGPVLEAMCGSGRLLLPLIQSGFDVEGVDNAPAMLERCRQRCRELDMAEPVLYEQDIQKLSLPRSYAAVIIAMASIQLLAGRQHVVETLKQLHVYQPEGGRLLIDTFLPTWAIVGYRKPIIIQHHLALPEGLLTYDCRVVVNLADQLMTSRKYYTKSVDESVVTQEIEDMTVYWYYRYEFDEMLRECGYKLLTVHERPYQEFPASYTYEAISVAR